MQASPTLERPARIADSTSPTFPVIMMMYLPLGMTEALARRTSAILTIASEASMPLPMDELSMKPIARLACMILSSYAILKYPTRLQCRGRAK